MSLGQFFAGGMWKDQWNLSKSPAQVRNGEELRARTKKEAKLDYEENLAGLGKKCYLGAGCTVSG